MTQQLSDALIDEANAGTRSGSGHRHVCLYPLNDAVRRVDLHDTDEVEFGRECPQYFAVDIQTNSLPFLTSISRKHFSITRRSDESGRECFILKNTSRNGTVVNRQPVLDQSEVVLHSGSLIGLHPNFSLFLFYDERDSLSANFPAEVTNRYVVTHKLGAGACGEVFLVYERGSGVDRRFAIKCVSKRSLNLNCALEGAAVVDRLRREVDILRRLSHPCIVKLERFINDEKQLFIVMDYVPDGDLFQLINKCMRTRNSGLQEPQAKMIFFQLVHAVAYLHAHSITHRDLKPENVLLCRRGDEMCVKLTDFGLSKMTTGNTQLRTYCGTPLYVAPEVLLVQHHGVYTQAIDCWSLGVTLFNMLTGCSPFSNERLGMPLQDQILTASYPIHLLSSFSPDAVDLVRSLITVDPASRISASSALQHPWLDDTAMKLKVNKLVGIPMHPLLANDGLSGVDNISNNNERQPNSDSQIRGSFFDTIHSPLPPQHAENRAGPVSTASPVDRDAPSSKRMRLLN